MREIKFRVWGLPDKDMLIIDDFYFFEEWGFNASRNFEERGYALMQYTGLKDKNAKEIYEGDIVKKGRWNFTVEFRDGSFEIIGIRIIAVARMSHDYRDLEVIGNIYENPELLDKK